MKVVCYRLSVFLYKNLELIYQEFIFDTHANVKKLHKKNRPTFLRMEPKSCGTLFQVVIPFYQQILCLCIFHIFHISIGQVFQHIFQ